MLESLQLVGPRGCIPVERMGERNKADKVPEYLIPSTREVVRMYEEMVGSLNNWSVTIYRNQESSYFTLGTLHLKYYFLMLFIKK